MRLHDPAPQIQSLLVLLDENLKHEHDPAFTLTRVDYGDYEGYCDAIEKIQSMSFKRQRRSAVWLRLPEFKTLCYPLFHVQFMCWPDDTPLDTEGDPALINQLMKMLDLTSHTSITCPDCGEWLDPDEFDEFE